MEDTIGATVSDTMKKASRDAQRMGRDIKENIEDAVSQGRRQALRASKRVDDFAHDNTALVTVAAFALGILLGYLVTRR